MSFYDTAPDGCCGRRREHNMTIINEDIIGKSDAEEFEKDFSEIIELADKALEQEPCTVDAKPIVHAHWIEGQTDNPNIHNILCSCCFEGYPSKGHANSQYTKKKFKWCPDCGAKMDEWGEEE